MRVTMVKKRLASGEPCEKCAQAEEMLRRRSLWDRIDEVLWAVEGDASSPGAIEAAKHGVALAPFFVVRDEEGRETVVTSTLRLVKQVLAGSAGQDAPAPGPKTFPVDLTAAAQELEGAEPIDVLRFGLQHYGERCAIAFSGAEEVVLIEMATRLGLPFSIFSLDTGRLPGETYEYLDDVRRRFGRTIEVVLPDAAEITALLETKGANSFYRDGHHECCAIRKLRPLRRILGRYDAWVTGARRGEHPPSALPVLQLDPTFRGASGELVRLNPLATLSRVDVLNYARRHDVPTHPLYKQGFARIGCAPCTRPRSDSPDEPDRWWWEGDAPAATSPDPGRGI